LWVNLFNLVWNTYLSYQTSHNSVVPTREPRKRPPIGDSVEQMVEMHMMSHALY
jgi:hypothetical protein